MEKRIQIFKPGLTLFGDKLTKVGTRFYCRKFKKTKYWTCDPSQRLSFVALGNESVETKSNFPSASFCRA